MSIQQQLRNKEADPKSWVEPLRRESEKINTDMGNAGLGSKAILAGPGGINNVLPPKQMPQQPAAQPYRRMGGPIMWGGIGPMPRSVVESYGMKFDQAKYDQEKSRFHGLTRHAPSLVDAPASFNEQYGSTAPGASGAKPSIQQILKNRKISPKNFDSMLQKVSQSKILTAGSIPDVLTKTQ